MSQFNKDGNLLGRIGALAVLAAAALLVGRIVCGGASCCMAPGSACPVPAVSQPAK